VQKRSNFFNKCQISIFVEIVIILNNLSKIDIKKVKEFQNPSIDKKTAYLYIKINIDPCILIVMTSGWDLGSIQGLGKPLKAWLVSIECKVTIVVQFKKQKMENIAL